MESENGALITADSCLQDDTVEAMPRAFWGETHGIFAGHSRQVGRATEDILGGLWQSQKDPEVLVPKDTWSCWHQLSRKRKYKPRHVHSPTRATVGGPRPLNYMLNHDRVNHVGITLSTRKACMIAGKAPLDATCQ